MNKRVKKQEIIEPERVIYGAFINCQRVIQKDLTDWFAIKLSSITTIVPINDSGTCLFYTYKDCCYHVEMSARELRSAINSFIFEPDSHWESYGN